MSCEWDLVTVLFDSRGGEFATYLFLGARAFAELSFPRGWTFATVLRTNTNSRRFVRGGGMGTHGIDSCITNNTYIVLFIT